MKKTFKFSVIITGDEVPEFMDGEKPGVIGVVEVEYDLTKKQYESPIFANVLLQKQHELLEEFVNVEIEEVK